MNERSIFMEALEKDTPEQRSSFLDEACAGDAGLRQRVEALLQSHEQAGSFLGKPVPGRFVEHRATPQGPSRTQADPATAEDGGGSLGFLLPSNKPDSLGRLGHYEILEVVGRGGMGIVLRALDETLHRVVAIKVMAAQLATNATARQRFTREAQAVAAVSHDHIVTIHAVEEANGLPYLVMQYVSGLSLQERLDRDGPLQVHEILRIGMQIAAGLATAHAQGLIHRDVKPANILLENGVERVKITDFGLARAASEASLTQSGVVAGTPQYMSPEQAEGKAVDQRTDLFSLGSVLYAMCTGRAPFRASGTMAVLKRVCEETPKPIPETNPDMPDWLVAIIDKLHAKDRAQRFQSAGEVADLLSRHLAHVQHPSLVGQVSRLPLETTARWKPTRRRRWAVAAAVLLLLLGGLSLTEATGVTDLRATVIRIFAREGTLVVEIDDPLVKVTIDGDGDVIITGAGPQEVRLKPGQYQVKATKNGKPVHEEWVTITRGRKEIVRIRREPAPAPKPLAAELLHSYVGLPDIVWSLAVSPDGRYVLAGFIGPAHLLLWDLDKKDQEPRRLEGHAAGGGWCVAISSNSRLAISGGHDGTLRLWDLKTGKELHCFEGHKRAVVSVAFSADGRLALSVSKDKTMRLWDLEAKKEVHVFEEVDTVRPCSVVFSPDGRRALTGGWDMVIRLWDLEKHDKVKEFHGHTGFVEGLAFLPNGRQFLSACRDGTLWLWDVESGQTVHRFAAHDWVNAVAVSADGRRALSGGMDGTICLWDLEGRTQVIKWGGHAGGVQGGAMFSPDGQRAISGGRDNCIRLWQLPVVERLPLTKP